MSRFLRSALAIAVVLAVGYSSWVWVASSEAPPPTAPPRQLGPVPVQVAPVEGREVVLQLDAFGNLEPRRTVTLSAQVTARIVAVHPRWRPGELVEAGEVLVELDATLFELDVRAAEAALAEAEAAISAAEVSERRARRSLAKATETAAVARREHERLVELGGVASDSGRDASLRARLAAERTVEESESALEASETELSAARVRRDAARVRLDRARVVLAQTRVTAPFRGRLRGRAPGLGTLATPARALGELIDPADLVLRARVPERDLLTVRLGQPATLVFPSSPETSDGPAYTGRVAAVDAASDPLTRRGVVEIELSGPKRVESEASDPAEPGQLGGIEPTAGTARADGDGVVAHEPELPAGLFTKATVELERLSGVVWIDRRHFAWEDGEPVAYVMRRETGGGEAGVAERRVLSFSREHGEGFLVDEGLAAGDVLVLHPLDRMEDGALVRVLETGGPER